ncbi:MAG: alcohol dehydrogenase catalytic domain-containing protein [Solirubrobacteraceae bacterium]|nr:alcohol dehydrogenase catalytic domain-containing protein [Solirubrobacteraceae bacterium]
MKALTYEGPQAIRCTDMPDPERPGERGVVVRVTTAGICGSDLHIYDGHGFSEDLGFCVGQEAVGEIVDAGPGVERFAVGDRVLVTASVGCSRCRECARGRVAYCERAGEVVGCYGLSAALQGSQAEFVAVPEADGNLVRLPDEISDEAAIVLTDNAPTGWYGARRARIAPGDTVAVIGLGPVGLMAAQAAFAMGAARVLGADLVAERRARAEAMGVEPVHPDDPKTHIRELTGGPGADAVVEAVGADATIKLALSAARHGGRVSVVGVNQNTKYELNMPLAQVKELEFHIGLCSVQYELPALLQLTAAGRLEPEAVVSHRLGLSEGEAAYALFAGRTDGVSKVVLDPAR